jgi:hypothetical protein
MYFDEILFFARNCTYLNTVKILSHQEKPAKFLIAEFLWSYVSSNLCPELHFIKLLFIHYFHVSHLNINITH